MDNKISTSFIPKSTITPGNLRTRREPVGIIVLFSLLILAISVLYFAGIYGYRYIVDSEINYVCPSAGQSGGDCKQGLQQTFDLAMSDLPTNELNDLKRLDTKLKNGGAVLASHITLRPFFAILAQLTVQNIQYTKFQFGKDRNFELSGVAKSYDDIAYQQKVFAGDQGKKYINSFTFSDFDLDPKGNVIFKLAMTVDQKLLTYHVDDNQ